MRAHVVVLAKPLVDDRLRLSGLCQTFGLEDLVAQRSVGAFFIAVLSRIAGIDLCGLDASPPLPVPEGCG